MGSILSNKEEVISGLAKLETTMTSTYKLSNNKFPILNAYLKARELKRTEEPMAADYISKKLYGMEYKTLLQQEKDNL